MKIDKIKEKLNNLVIGIANTAIDTNGRVPKFWQLYLDAKVELGLDIVDTCATSQCLSILAKASYQDVNLINDAVSSVIRLRNSQGSWPSAITVDELESPEKRRRGDTAIGDNCFALTALIDAGFLNEQFRYGALLSTDLQNLYSRIEFVYKAVNWLLENKAKDGLGWYYTDEKNDVHSSVTLTTINVLQVLSKIIFELDKCCKNSQLTTEQQSNCNRFKKSIVSEIEEIANILTAPYNIYDNIQNDWKAIGTSIKSSAPSIIHTCKLVNLILYNKKYNGIALYSDVNDLIQYVLDNTKSLEAFDSLCNEFYFENYALHKLNALGLPAPTIQVDHENFAEGIVLYTLIEIKMNGVLVQDEIIENMLNALIKRMNPLVPNFYYCRSERAKENNCWHPVYASYEAYIALNSYIDSLKVNSSVDITLTDIVDLAIKQVKVWVNKHKLGHLATVSESKFDELIAKFDKIRTGNDDEKQRVENAKIFLRRVLSENPEIDVSATSEFISFISDLANRISSGRL